MTTEPLLISPKQAAILLSISKPMVYRMLQAAEEAAKIAKGEKLAIDVQEDVRPYLDAGFPLPVKLTPTTTRINKADLMKWIAAKGKSHV